MMSTPETEASNQLPEPILEIKPDQVLKTVGECIAAAAIGIGGAVALNFIAEKLAQVFGN